MTQQILSWFTPTGLRPVPYYTVRISTKNDPQISLYTLAPRKNTSAPCRKHPAETYSRNWRLYRVHCKAQNNPCWSPQQVTPHTESTVRNQTLTEPFSKSHPVQNPLHRSELPIQAIQTQPKTAQFQNLDDYKHKCTSILNRLQNRNERRSKKAYSVRFNQQNSISNQN